MPVIIFCIIFGFVHGCDQSTSVDSEMLDVPDPTEIITIPGQAFALGTNPDGSLLVSETFEGLIEIRKSTTDHIAALQNINGIATVGNDIQYVITGDPFIPEQQETGRKLYRITPENTQEIADFWAFEQSVNPDRVWSTLPPESNPYGIEQLNDDTFLVADAAGNSVLVVDESGAIDWVAVLTPQPASTENFKHLIGCVENDQRPPCQMPEEIPAEPVPTGLAIGPDGGYYVGELVGFPEELGIARIWRIEPGSRQVLCPGESCTLVADGFTAIMDMAFGPDGTLYVVEFDAAGWFALQDVGGFPLTPIEGGRVKACNVGTGECVVIADELNLPTGITVGKDGTIWIAENEGIDVAPNPNMTASIRAVK